MCLCLYAHIYLSRIQISFENVTEEEKNQPHLGEIMLSSYSGLLVKRILVTLSFRSAGVGETDITLAPFLNL